MRVTPAIQIVSAPSTSINTKCNPYFYTNMRFYILLITTIAALVTATPVPGERDIGCCFEAARLSARCAGFDAVSNTQTIL